MGTIMQAGNINEPRAGARRCGVAALAAVAAVALGLVATGGSAAHAALQLTVSSSGGGLTSVTDGGVGDLAPAADAIVMVQSFGGFQVTIDSGVSNSPGNPLGATLAVTTTAVRDTNIFGIGPTLTVSVTDTDFTIPQGNALSLTSGGGGSLSNSTSGDLVTFRSYADPANVAYSTGAASTALQSFISPGQAGSLSYNVSNVPATIFASPGDYSLTNITTITLAPALSQGVFSGTTTVQLVPEPTVGLLGIGVAGLALRRTRRRSA